MGLVAVQSVFGVQILSKSKLEKCEKNSDSDDNLNCTKKVVLNMAVPSGSVIKIALFLFFFFWVLNVYIFVYLFVTNGSPGKSMSIRGWSY